MSDNALAVAAARIEELTRELNESKQNSAKALQQSNATIEGLTAQLQASQQALHEAQLLVEQAKESSSSIVRLTAELQTSQQALQHAEQTKQASDSTILNLQSQVEQLRTRLVEQQQSSTQATNQINSRLASETAAKESAQRAQAAAETELLTVKRQVSPNPQLQSRIDELEALMADPPASSEIQIAQYLNTEGTVLKKFFRTSDGSKFKVLPEAQRYQTKLALVDLGLSEQAADKVIERGDTVVTTLQALNPTPTPTPTNLNTK